MGEMKIYAALGAAAALAAATVIQVRAANDKFTFPDGFDKGVQYLTLDKPDKKEVQVFYAPKEAIAAAVDYAKKNNAPGGVIAIVDEGGNLMALERLDGTFAMGANGNPEKDANGRFIKDTLRQYAVMRKEKGWGTEYPADKRNGEWEYRIFTAEHQWNDKVPAGVCLDCHLPKAGQDFVWSYDDLKKGQ